MPGSTDLYNNILHILGLLFDREEAHLLKREQSIGAKNIALSGPSDGFRHMGQLYTQLTGAARSRGNYSRLDPSLCDEMDAIVKERETVIRDKDRVKQALSMVLRDCYSRQDMRDALPNGLAAIIPACQGLERQRPEAFTLADNERSYKQYMNLREKIEFYVASRLLY